MTQAERRIASVRKRGWAERGCGAGQIGAGQTLTRSAILQHQDAGSSAPLLDGHPARGRVELNEALLRAASAVRAVRGRVPGHSDRAAAHASQKSRLATVNCLQQFL